MYVTENNLERMKIPMQTLVLFSVVLHLVFIVYGEWQDEHFEVKYTDIDYRVITDAAKYVLQGKSPFARHTYRYTPFLAYFMIPNVLFHKAFGKVLFSLFNIATGYVIYKISSIFQGKDSKLPLICAIAWMCNPLTFAVSTRGNAESLMTFLVMCTVFMLYKRKYFLCGILYGFAVHFKLYPAVYALPIFLHLSFLSEKQLTLKNMLRNVFLPNKNLRSFVVSSFLAFTIPTAVSLWKYPNEYYYEALLYHVSRRDMRHNFSPYFYMLYLTDHWNSEAIGLVLFVPQILLLFLFAMKYSYGNDIMFCLFCETFVFVTFNKVCTSQYFLWFLCFFSSLIPHFRMSWMKCLILISVWFGSQAVWLYFAYQLEFMGENTLFILWGSSLLFFAVNSIVLSQMVKCYNMSKCKKK